MVAAVLAAVPLALVDDTVLVVAAGVGEVFAYRPLEKPFAALAAVNPVVFTCGGGGGGWFVKKNNSGICDGETHQKRTKPPSTVK